MAKKGGKKKAEIKRVQGRFAPGQSGNPAGRPKGKKNQITELKQDLEIAVRKQMSSAKIAQIVEKLYDLALNEGHVGAAKLLLDKTVSNAKDGEEDSRDGGGIQVTIRNVTAEIKSPTETIEAEEADYEEVH
jgi:hypothetical protein